MTSKQMEQNFQMSISRKSAYNSNFVGFLELGHQCGVSNDIRRGAQGASRVAPGNSGLHASGEGERLIALEPW